MPKQLPVIPLATLLAHSEYVKQSQYTPRRTRKRKRGSGSKVHTPRKQTPMTQPEVAPVPLPDGAQQQIVPVIPPVSALSLPPANPAPKRRIVVQNVSVSVEIHIDPWQQQAWADDHHQAASSDWQPEQPRVAQPPPVQPPDVQPSEVDIPKWVVTLIAFVVSLISTLLFGRIFL
jgi:hypothetical protein